MPSKTDEKPLTLPLFPILTTPRLIIRQAESASDSDQEFLIRCLNDPINRARQGDRQLRTPDQVRAFSGTLPLSHRTLVDAFKASGREKELPQDVLSGARRVTLGEGGLCFIVYEKVPGAASTSLPNPRLEGHAVGEPVGHISVMGSWPPVPHIGWIFLEGYQGKGYATEAAQAVKDFLINDFGIKEMMCVTNYSNPASANVAKKIGFVQSPEPLIMKIPPGTDVGASKNHLITDFAGETFLERSVWILPDANPFEKGTIYNFLGGDPERR